MFSAMVWFPLLPMRNVAVVPELLVIVPPVLGSVPALLTTAAQRLLPSRSSVPPALTCSTWPWLPSPVLPALAAVCSGRKIVFTPPASCRPALTVVLPRYVSGLASTAMPPPPTVRPPPVR